MKKIFLCLISILLSVILTMSLFACDSTPEKAKVLSTDELATKCAGSILSQEQASAASQALLTLLRDADMEEAEIRAVLLAATKSTEDLAPALLAVCDGRYDLENIIAYRTALQLVADTVSPEVAGALFYTAATKVKEDLPYSLSDCRKLASLLLRQDAAFGTDFLDRLLSADLEGVNEIQLNTMLLSLASSLRAALGISQDAKAELHTLLLSLIDSTFQAENVTAETIQALNRSKALFTSLSSLLTTRYDEILTYAAEYLSRSGAKLFLGIPYEKTESISYYGYYYATWEKVPLSLEEYQDRAGDYDEYLAVRSLSEGFIENGVFTPLSEEDCALYDRICRLQIAINAYDALTQEGKAAFRDTIDEFLTILSSEQDLVGNLIGREPSEDRENDTADFDQTVAALGTLSSLDLTKSLTPQEKAAAKGAIARYESFLHGYLPLLY